jgi:hypothetical protein
MEVAVDTQAQVAPVPRLLKAQVQAPQAKARQLKVLHLNQLAQAALAGSHLGVDHIAAQALKLATQIKIETASVKML